MGILVLVFFYGSALFCVAALVFKAISYVRAPLQLNWSPTGAGSVHDSPEQWRVTARGTWKKLGTIALDVLFLRGYYRRDRRFWSVLYLFHSGLYLLILWHAWLFISGASITEGDISISGIIWGHAGTSMVLAGATGILTMRIIDRHLRAYYPPVHFIKWGVMIATIAAGFYAVQFYFGGDPSKLIQYVGHQLEFNLKYKINAPVPTSLHLLAAVPWLIYLPFSHITRMFFRYLYILRWDNQQNYPGNTVSKHLPGLLGNRTLWSAPHIRSVSHWSEVTTALPEDKKETRSA